MAIIKISIIASDTRWAKEIRFLGIPVYLIRELDVKTRNVEQPKRIGFQNIGDAVPQVVNIKENTNTKTYGKKED